MRCRGIYNCKNENKKAHTQELLKRKLENLDAND